MSAATQTIVNQLGYNPEVAPYLRENMAQARALTYNYKMGPDGRPILGADGMPVIESFKAPEQYGGQAPVQVPVLDAAGKPVIGADGYPVTQNKIGADGKVVTEFRGYERLAGLSDLQKQAMQGARDMATPKYDDAGKYIPTANENAQALALQATKDLGNASYTGNKYASAYTAPTSFGYTADTYGGASAGAATAADRIGASAATLGAAPTAIAQTTGYNPTLTKYQMGDPSKVSTKSFTDQGTAGSYMSPYIQNVVDIQQREAQRQADIAATQQQSAATRAGAFGGGRDAIMRAEAARNLATQKGDIQAQGLQAAYQQAQQQFNAEQGYGLQGQIANQQAGLTQGQQNLGANLGVQQLGTQTGLQTALANLNNQQQAELANQALKGQYGLSQGQMSQQANMQTSSQAQQAALQDAAAKNQMAQYNASNLQQAGLAGAAAKNQAAQFGADQRLTSAGLAAQYGQAANQLTEQSGQFGANFGLQGDQAALQGATALSNIGGQGFNQNMQTNQLLAGYGNQQQQQEQQRLSTLYQDFLNQQNDPYKKIGFMANTASAAPTANLGSTMYQAPPSTLSQIGGLGASALGVFGASGGFGTKSSAGGGMVGRYAKGGLVKSRPQGLVALAIHSMA